MTTLEVAPRGSGVDAHFSPDFDRLFSDFIGAVTRVWHRYRVRGAGRIPARPCLFVGNHSGIGIVDVLCLLGARRSVLGSGRRVVGMMHDAFLAPPVLGHICRAFGAVRAHPDNARDAFARGYDVMVFPGGDLDAGRPFYQPRDVVFGPRRGYVRMALEQNVPIVPVATIGSHFTYLLLPGTDVVARATGLDRALRSSRPTVPIGLLLPIAAAMGAIAGLLPAWTVAAGAALAVVPTPARVTSEFLEPIDIAARTAHVTDPIERVELAHGIVHGALAEAVRTMRHAP